jgi:hypothetical protein
MIKNSSKLLIICLLLLIYNISAQTGDVKVGSSSPANRYFNAGFFDYSDPEAINVTVSVWGYVRYPGKYLVPNYSSVKDLISYAGGPTENSNLGDLRLYKVLKDSTRMMYKFDYNDLLWDEKLDQKKESLPKLEVGDILVVPGEPRMFFRDYFTMTLSVVSTLISLSILVLNIVRK